MPCRACRAAVSYGLNCDFMSYNLEVHVFDPPNVQHTRFLLVCYPISQRLLDSSHGQSTVINFAANSGYWTQLVQET